MESGWQKFLPKLDGPASAAQLYSPQGLATDAAGNLYIAEQGNRRVRRVDAATGVIATVAGNGDDGYAGDGGLATQATLGEPMGVALDLAGNLYIGTGNRIRRVDAKSQLITTATGTGHAGFARYGGRATAV